MVPALTDDQSKDILDEARTRFAYACEVDKENRENQREDTRFVYEPGAQWSQEIRKERKALSDDPCLEFNQCKQFVHQVVNDQRQSRPGIRIHPASGDASEDVAEIEQGLIRGIEYDSQAEAVYDGGYQQIVVGGRGFWRVVSEYEGPDTFTQKLVIKGISDPLSAFPDPDYQAPDGSDQNWCFVIDTLKVEDFKKKYPKAGNPTSWPIDGAHAHWRRPGDEIVVADYYRRVAKKRTLVQLSDGYVGWKDEIPSAVLADPAVIVDEREADDYTVEWYTLAGGNKVLEQHEWPGTIIPVVQDMGDTIVVDGKRIYQGLIRQARDSQSLFNFAMTAQAIHLALSPRAPWIMAEGQAEGYETLYQNANRADFGYLYYKPVTVDGNLAPPPQRQQPSMPDAGWVQMGQQLTGLLRSTMGGLYENTLGMRGAETSGRAILAREKQGDNATFHYADNHARAIALTGRIIVELIPHYYDTERIVHIVGDDDVRKMVKINEQAVNPDNPLEAIKKNDVTSGKYSVVVASGPTYATKRQESADLLMQMVQAVPDLMKVAGDIIVKAQEIPDADQLADRLKFLLPPQIQQAEAAKQGEEGAPPIPPAAQMQIQQMQQAIQQMQQALQQAQQQGQMLQAENQQLKSGEQTKVEVEKMATEAQTLKAGMDNATKLLLEMLKGQEAPAGAPVEHEQQIPIDQQMATIASLTEQVIAMGQQMAQIVSAPRQISLQTDQAGNPVGAVSVPMMQ